MEKRRRVACEQMRAVPGSIAIVCEAVGNCPRGSSPTLPLLIIPRHTTVGDLLQTLRGQLNLWFTQRLIFCVGEVPVLVDRDLGGLYDLHSDPSDACLHIQYRVLTRVPAAEHWVARAAVIIAFAATLAYLRRCRQK